MFLLQILVKAVAVVRAETMKVRDQEYVKGSQPLGAGNARIIIHPLMHRKAWHTADQGTDAPGEACDCNGRPAYGAVRIRLGHSPGVYTVRGSNDEEKYCPFRLCRIWFLSNYECTRRAVRAAG